MTRWNPTATRCEPDGDSSGSLTPLTAVSRRSAADAPTVGVAGIALTVTDVPLEGALLQPLAVTTTV